MYDPYASYGGYGGGSKSKKSAVAANGVGYKKLKDGRPVTTKRLQREYEIEQDREARRKEMVRRCREVLNLTKKHRYHKIFLFPVDPVRQGIPDYPQIVKNPMDLGTVKRKLDERKYVGPEDFCADMRLIFSNCALYNGSQSDAGIMGETVHQGFEAAWLQSGLDDWTASEQTIRAQEEIDIRNTPTTPISVEAVAVQEAREQLENMRREIEELKRAKQEAIPSRDRSRVRAALQERNEREIRMKIRTSTSMTHEWTKTCTESSRRKAEREKKSSARLVLRWLCPSGTCHSMKSTNSRCRVIQIVSEQRKGLGQADDDEIEINIEELDSETLWKLDKYVRGVLRPKKRKLNAAEQLLEAKMREAQAARDLAAVEDTLKQVQETGGSYKEVVDKQKGVHAKPAKKTILIRTHRAWTAPKVRAATPRRAQPPFPPAPVRAPWISPPTWE
ncbi:associates with the basal transcription factor [Ostreococcus tauri]|uniref:Associates with the basal transcription factor n=1 Tax=Ostreococcus tauri TaxID=70448 RepID=A0A1Y5IHW5_OSTTA|nr:associates with the basal transcription factor [Ostreococcus tauri]